MAIDWEALPPDLADLARERFGSGPAPAKPKANPYSPYRSKLEWRFAEHLRGAKLAGLIRDWEYEPCPFDLAGRCRFTPDFWVKGRDESWTFVETKGPHAWEDSIIKLKVCAAQHPEYRWLLVTAGKGHLWIAREVDGKGIGTSPIEVNWI